MIWIVKYLSELMNILQKVNEYIKTNLPEKGEATASPSLVLATACEHCVAQGQWYDQLRARPCG